MMSIFETELTADDAEARTKHYTPSVQETAEETPYEQIDNSPLTESQRRGLDSRDETGRDNQHSPVGTAAAPTFIPPGDWVSPVRRHRQRQAMLLPFFATINDLDARITAVLKYDGAPKVVVDQAQRARLAVSEAREVRNAASHPENPKYTRSVEAKDEVVKAMANATTLVDLLEREAVEVREEWFASLTGNLDRQRADALKALKAAEKAYASLRGSVNGAQAMALESGRWDKSWHQSTTREADLNAPIAAMRAAIGYLESEDDVESGRFLTEDYDGKMPPHTLAKLERGAEISQVGSFARQIYARARSAMTHDKDLQEALQTKHLIPFLNSNPLTTELMGRESDDED